MRPGSHPPCLHSARYETAQAPLIALLALRHDPEALLYHPAPRLHRKVGEATRSTATACCCRKSRFDEQLRASGGPEGSPAQLPRNISLTPPGSDSLTLMAASAAAGRSGVNADGYPDYRGVNVVGAWRWMASCNFGIAVEADSVEAIPGISLIQNALAGITLVACALLVFIALMSNRQRPGCRTGSMPRPAICNMNRPSCSACLIRRRTALSPPTIGAGSRISASAPKVSSVAGKVR